MTKTERRQKLIQAFFNACEDGTEAATIFIRDNVFQETKELPEYTAQPNENILQTVGRKYSELDDFAIAVGNHLTGKPTDSTPDNITIAMRIEEFSKYKPELAETMHAAFKEAGHRYVIPLLRTEEYAQLKAAEEQAKRKPAGLVRAA